MNLYSSCLHSQLLQFSCKGPYIYEVHEKPPIFAPLTPLPHFLSVRMGTNWVRPPPPFTPIPFGVLAKNWTAKNKTKMLPKDKFPPEPDTCLSGTLIAEPDTCMVHCLHSNNTYTNYSCGHLISVGPLPLPCPCNHSLPSEF